MENPNQHDAAVTSTTVDKNPRAQPQFHKIGGDIYADSNTRYKFEIPQAARKQDKTSPKNTDFLSKFLANSMNSQFTMGTEDTLIETKNTSKPTITVNTDICGLFFVMQRNSAIFYTEAEKAIPAKSQTQKSPKVSSGEGSQSKLGGYIAKSKAMIDNGRPADILIKPQTSQPSEREARRLRYNEKREQNLAQGTQNDQSKSSFPIKKLDTGQSNLNIRNKLITKTAKNQSTAAIGSLKYTGSSNYPPSTTQREFRKPLPINVTLKSSEKVQVIGEKATQDKIDTKDGASNRGTSKPDLAIEKRSTSKSSAKNKPQLGLAENLLKLKEESAARSQRAKASSSVAKQSPSKDRRATTEKFIKSLVKDRSPRVANPEVPEREPRKREGEVQEQLNSTSPRRKAGSPTPASGAKEPRTGTLAVKVVGSNSGSAEKMDPYPPLKIFYWNPCSVNSADEQKSELKKELISGNRPHLIMLVEPFCEYQLAGYRTVAGKPLPGKNKVYAEVLHRSELPIQVELVDVDLIVLKLLLPEHEKRQMYFFCVYLSHTVSRQTACLRLMELRLQEYSRDKAAPLLFLVGDFNVDLFKLDTFGNDPCKKHLSRLVKEYNLAPAGDMHLNNITRQRVKQVLSYDGMHKLTTAKQEQSRIDWLLTSRKHLDVHCRFVNKSNTLSDHYAFNIELKLF